MLAASFHLFSVTLLVEKGRWFKCVHIDKQKVFLYFKS